jgi:hypothetical protein
MLILAAAIAGNGFAQSGGNVPYCCCCNGYNNGNNPQQAQGRANQQQQPPPPPQQSRSRDYLNEYTPKDYDSGKVHINAGVGYDALSAYLTAIPPLSAAVDFKLPVEIPLSLGISASYATYSYAPYGGLYDFGITISNIGIGARAMYHIIENKTIDLYLGPLFGYVLVSMKVDGASSSYYESLYQGVPFFNYGAIAGVRLFLGSKVGLYIEGGYSLLQVISGGLTIKI